MHECVCIGFQVWWLAGMASALEPSAIQGSWTPVPDGTGGFEQEPAWNTHRPHFQVSAHTFSCPTFCLTLCVSSFHYISLYLVTFFVCVSSFSFPLKSISLFLNKYQRLLNLSTCYFLHLPHIFLFSLPFFLFRRHYWFVGIKEKVICC